MRFIAMARFSCASLLMLPKLIAPGREAPHDLRRRLDLVERHGRPRGDEVPAAAQRERARRPGR